MFKRRGRADRESASRAKGPARQSSIRSRRKTRGRRLERAHRKALREKAKERRKARLLHAAAIRRSDSRSSRGRRVASRRALPRKFRALIRGLA